MKHHVFDINRLFTGLQSRDHSCGVILAVCKEDCDKRLDLLEKDMAFRSKAFSARYAYDPEQAILGVLLEEQRLSGTHYFALILKDYLQGHNLLAGNLLIASFPVNVPETGQTLMRMMQELRELDGSGEIRIYDTRVLSSKEAARILLVNHDETITEFLSVYLQRKGYEVTVASDGMTGVQKYREIAPDLVITDLNLPVINGYQLMQRIQDERAGRQSKIVVLTDKRLEEDVQKSFALGAADYITKPFSPVELAARVKRLIS